MAFGTDGTDTGVNLATEVTTDEAIAGAEAAVVVVDIAGAEAAVVGVVDGSVFEVVPVTAANTFVTGANALDGVEVVGVVDGSVVEVGVAARLRCRHKSASPAQLSLSSPDPGQPPRSMSQRWSELTSGAYRG